MTATTQHPVLASEIFAEAFGLSCEGPESCHWCGAGCKRFWLHDEPAPAPFTRPTKTARRPSSPFVCVACWRWRWKSVTVNFLSGGFRDRLTASGESWLITPAGAYAVRHEACRHRLYDHLLNPPVRFVLALIDPGCVNMLQFAEANDNALVRRDTPLAFTVNNVAHLYSAYELEHALRNGGEGTPPGVRALLRMLGDYSLPPHASGRPPVLPRGKPPTLLPGQTTKEVVTASGSPAKTAPPGQGGKNNPNRRL